MIPTGVWLFHGTNINNLANIVKNGLMANCAGQNHNMSLGCIYLSSQYGQANFWAVDKPGEIGIVLAIDWSKIDNRKLCQDENLSDNPTSFEYWADKIPPDWIEVEWRNHWYSLDSLPDSLLQCSQG